MRGAGIVGGKGGIGGRRVLDSWLWVSGWRRAVKRDAEWSSASGLRTRRFC